MPAFQIPAPASLPVQPPHTTIYHAGSEDLDKLGPACNHMPLQPGTVRASSLVTALITSPLEVSLSGIVSQSMAEVPFSDITFAQDIGSGSFKTVYRGRWDNTTVVSTLWTS